jgi:transcriptional regulator with XRE-family HTH domain
MNNTDLPTQKHHGRNVKRLREIMGIKQEALAAELGINQQKMSFLEQKETIEDEQMEEIAKALKVPLEVVKNFDEQKTINNISCSFSDNSVNNNAINIQHINPVDKWLEAIEENKKLYEQLLKSEREKVALLEKILAAKN